jgi:hypothetical protein
MSSRVEPRWQGVNVPPMTDFTDSHNDEIITTLFVMVHGWVDVRQGEWSDEA